MRIRVTNHLDSLTDDMADVVKRAPRGMVKVVREGIRVGNDVAKDYAKRSSGTHARLYPYTFKPEMRGVVEFGGVFGYSGEYGPVADGQGMLAPLLERGSRNNPPHNDLAKSADLIGPSFAQEVRDLPDDWFWS